MAEQENDEAVHAVYAIIRKVAEEVKNGQRKDISRYKRAVWEKKIERMMRQKD